MSIDDNHLNSFSYLLKPVIQSNKVEHNTRYKKSGNYPLIDNNYQWGNNSKLEHKEFCHVFKVTRIWIAFWVLSCRVCNQYSEHSIPLVVDNISIFLLKSQLNGIVWIAHVIQKQRLFTQHQTHLKCKHKQFWNIILLCTYN